MTIISRFEVSTTEPQMKTVFADNVKFENGFVIFVSNKDEVQVAYRADYVKSLVRCRER